MAGGTSLQVLRLGIGASTAGGMVQSRVGEQGFPYAPWHRKKKKVTLEGTKYLLAVFDNPHGVNVASQNAVEKRC